MGFIFKLRPHWGEASVDVMRISWFTSLWCLRWDRCSCIGQLFGEFLPRWMPHRLRQHDPGDSAFDDATQTEPNRLEAPCLQWFMWLARRGLCAIILKFELWFGNLWDILTCEAMPELMEGSLLNDSPCFGQRSKRLTRGIMCSLNLEQLTWKTNVDIAVVPSAWQKFSSQHDWSPRCNCNQVHPCISMLNQISCGEIPSKTAPTSPCHRPQQRPRSPSWQGSNPLKDLGVGMPGP